ncbi:fungal-specific transcription factor domain-containing protein [Aureobasidium pullulans]|uniref:Fungal-specific transcription factor domain-containing protein n=1 Tax=Aureobasidium pullulans TaxID=5580 RepID=A0A4S8STR3_AURPU|nr:fungal-specific transcription factor domain-containing protein [Aureobasidium pullulans]
MYNIQNPPISRDQTPESPGAISGQVPGPSSLSRGACEACRSRKCRRADIECVHPGIKPREKRSRVLITPQYEKKIDLIDSRLEEVVGLLRNLSTHVSAPGNTHDDVPVPPPAHPSPVRRALPSNSENAAVVEGSSSLSAHSVFVNQLLQGLVGVQQPDGDIQRTLTDLADIASTPQDTSSATEVALPNAGPSETRGQKKFKLPPIQNAANLIRAAQAQRLAGSGWVYGYILMQSFSDLCLQVYFSEPVSPYDCISVNAGLFSLFWDHALTAQTPQSEKEQCLAYARLCRNNLETGLAELPLHLPESPSVIAALIFGAYYAIEFSTASLCWSLASKASALCQTLGYHRTVTSHDRVVTNSKYTRFLFWTTYYLDKSLSLRLGRASTIQDWDVTAIPPSASSTDQEPVFAFFALWVKTARCQGDIYEMLYSPAAATQPEQVRRSRVGSLASSLYDIAQETERTKNQWLKTVEENTEEHLMDFYAVSDEVLRLSLLTHVYRAAPRDTQSSTTFNPTCIQVARATLDRHHDCIAIIQKANDIWFSIYVKWTLLFAPFVPFIVVFCHVMETRDHADLARLEAFVNSIHAATTVSEPAAKMHRLFQVLHNIATRYLELGGMGYNHGKQSSVPSMDTQLAALGFPHAEHWEMNNAPTDFDFGIDGLQQHNQQPQPLNSILWAGNELQLEEWLYNSQASMETLQSGDSSRPDMMQ